MYNLLKWRLKNGVFHKLIYTFNYTHGSYSNTLLRYYYFLNGLNILYTIRLISWFWNLKSNVYIIVLLFIVIGA